MSTLQPRCPISEPPLCALPGPDLHELKRRIRIGLKDALDNGSKAEWKNFLPEQPLVLKHAGPSGVRGDVKKKKKF
ncbi:hypothetical protein BDZ45DRAFT_750485 [Acephala macrosclerotiorum]|nr:hypothetical protein BDZ45DRAFT_750485 [Acephala macrosclerotiorum]